jgi:hypothetical protein
LFLESSLRGSSCLVVVVSGDIVVGNVKYRRIQGVWTMTPSGTGGMFHIDPRRRELLDEIERLRAEASRSCINCASGVARQRNEPGEVVVSCRGPLRGNAFLMPFSCSQWKERSEH